MQNYIYDCLVCGGAVYCDAGFRGVDVSGRGGRLWVLSWVLREGERRGGKGD